VKRLALVTGALGGVGRATVRAFEEAGWRVVAIDKKPAEEIGGADTRFRRVDVAEPEQFEALVRELQAVEPGLDALVNNAAIQVCKPLVETSLAEWDAVMASNLRAAFVAAKACFPLLKAARGAIVNISSVHAIASSRSIAAYATSKGGLVTLTRAMALEFGADGVRANVVLPGATDTPMLRSGLMRGHLDGAGIHEMLADLGRRHVLGRVAAPAEVAEAIVFLADSARSSFMTGQALVVDGGATIRLSTE
jgi:glucose 1-dehydrogenase